MATRLKLPRHALDVAGGSLDNAHFSCLSDMDYDSLMSEVGWSPL